jgi:hypothetical protein
MPRKTAESREIAASETAPGGIAPGALARRATPQSQEMPSNVELKRLIDATKTRLENWTLEVQRDPDPRMVHVLKNILGHINEFTKLTDAKVEYSYKTLSKQMSVLLQEVASLNAAIMDALMDDDLVSAAEEELINDVLRRVVQAAVELIRIVQQAFIGRHRPQIPETAGRRRR